MHSTGGRGFGYNKHAETLRVIALLRFGPGSWRHRLLSIGGAGRVFGLVDLRGGQNNARSSYAKLPPG
jgi:hypothetical protein